MAEFNPDHIMYAGAIGIFLGLLFFLFFLYRRIHWIIRVLSKRETTSPGLLSSLSKLALIALWTSCFGLILFLGFFLRTYHAFTYEKPVAEIRIQAFDRTPTGPVAIVYLTSPHIQSPRHLIIKGNQWMIEGDILKWKNWLHFLGLESRYRLTRLRGRYLNPNAEAQKPPTIHALTLKEKDPLWQYLYQYGHRLPFISTVYGNAAFQYLGEDKTYLIYVGPSGFIVREKMD